MKFPVELMRYCCPFVLFILTASNLASFVTHPWHDVRVKHAWDAVPQNWECLGPPPPGTTINLHLVLKPHNEDALTDTLLEVSTPNNPKHVILNITLSLIYLLVQSSLQIWRTFVQGGGC